MARAQKSKRFEEATGVNRARPPHRCGISPQRAYSLEPERHVPRTLRMQVLAIAVVSIGVVVGLSGWLAARLSENALRVDLVDRVATGIERIAGALPAPDHLENIARNLVLDNRDVAGLAIYVKQGPEWTLVTSAPDQGSAGSVDLPALQAAADGREPPAAILLPGGAPGVRVVRTVALAGGRTALVRADVSLEALARLRRHLRLVDLALFVVAVGLLAVVLDQFFRRRVEPRIDRLTHVMDEAAEGRFDEPIAPLGAVELDSLATSLNRMLRRVHDLTQGLEGRVAEATTELASRNDELEERSEELRELQAEAVRSERFAALGQTVATLAHELGTPLNSVLGYAQLLKQDETNPEQAAKLAVIESQVRRMIETIQRMLGHSREGLVEREPVDLSHLVDEVLALVNPRAQEENIRLDTSIEEVGVVEIDPIAVRQVMVNLINNALDADGTTRVTMNVRTRATGDGARDLEIDVQDDGGGIPKAEQKSIFEPFYTTKESGRGTGLGLAIVEHLVRAHAGQIVLDSAPEQGSTFHVRFPCGGTA